MKKTFEKKVYDVAVIGGGPAGMMAAGQAARLGARVVLLEKNPTLGKKLLITGKGRCNITQAKFDPEEFIEALNDKKGRFLFSSLASFGSKEAVDFFEKNGLPLKTERGGRIFPQSDRAQDVLKILASYLKKGQVKIICGRPVLGLEAKDGKIKSVHLGKKSSQSTQYLFEQKIAAKNFILATGGKSYPVLGSTGDGYAWAKKLGHQIIPPAPALSPILSNTPWIKELQGLSLKNVTVSLFQNNKKQAERFGEMIFTHFGLSGPIILDLSKKINQLLSQEKVFLEIDLKPALDFPVLEKRLERDFSQSPARDFKNYLPEILPQKMIPAILELVPIDPRKKTGLITKEERKKLAHCLKNLRVEAAGLVGWQDAIVTSGGVNLKEVSPKTMQSKIIPNLFLAGEILDLDGPTGGYNLQICWSTGYIAGTAAVKNPLFLKKNPVQKQIFPGN